MNESLLTPLKEGASLTIGSIGDVIKPGVLILLGCVLFFLIIKLIEENKK